MSDYTLVRGEDGSLQLQLAKYVVGRTELPGVGGNPWHDTRTGQFADGPPGVRIIAGRDLLKQTTTPQKLLIQSHVSRTKATAIGVYQARDGTVTVVLANGPNRVAQFSLQRGPEAQKAVAAQKEQIPGQGTPGNSENKDTPGEERPDPATDARRQEAVSAVAKELPADGVDGVRDFVKSRYGVDLQGEDLANFRDEVAAERGKLGRTGTSLQDTAELMDQDLIQGKGITHWHGTYTVIDRTKRYPLHIGTRKAAEERMADVSYRARDLDGTERKLKYYPLRFPEDLKVYPKVLSDDTAKRFSPNIGKQSQSADSKRLIDSMKALGYEAVAYRNDEEDNGSLSYVVFDHRRLEQGDIEYPDAEGLPDSMGTVSLNKNFPRRITDGWLSKEVGGLSDDLFRELINLLRLREWTDEDMETRVYRYRPQMKERASQDPELTGKQEPQDLKREEYAVIVQQYNDGEIGLETVDAYIASRPDQELGPLLRSIEMMDPTGVDPKWQRPRNRIIAKMADRVEAQQPRPVEALPLAEREGVIDKSRYNIAARTLARKIIREDRSASGLQKAIAGFLNDIADASGLQRRGDIKVMVVSDIPGGRDAEVNGRGEMRITKKLAKEVLRFSIATEKDEAPDMKAISGIAGLMHEGTHLFRSDHTWGVAMDEYRQEGNGLFVEEGLTEAIAGWRTARLLGGMKADQDMQDRVMRTANAYTDETRWARRRLIGPLQTAFLSQGMDPDEALDRAMQEVFQVYRRNGSVGARLSEIDAIVQREGGAPLNFEGLPYSVTADPIRVVQLPGRIDGLFMRDNLARLGREALGRLIGRVGDGKDGSDNVERVLDEVERRKEPTPQEIDVLRNGLAQLRIIQADDEREERMLIQMEHLIGTEMNRMPDHSLVAMMRTLMVDDEWSERSVMESLAIADRQDLMDEIRPSSSDDEELGDGPSDEELIELEAEGEELHIQFRGMSDEERAKAFTNLDAGQLGDMSERYLGQRANMDDPMSMSTFQEISRRGREAVEENQVDDLTRLDDKIGRLQEDLYSADSVSQDERGQLLELERERDDLLAARGAQRQSRRRTALEPDDVDEYGQGMERTAANEILFTWGSSDEYGKREDEEADRLAIGKALNDEYGISISDAITMFDSQQLEEEGVTLRVNGRMANQSIVFEGEFFDREDNSIGAIDRSIMLGPARLQTDEDAYHSLLELRGEWKGRNIGGDLLFSHIRMYRKAGISNIGLFANIEDGGYVWGLYGFEPADVDLFDRIKKQLREQDDDESFEKFWNVPLQDSGIFSQEEPDFIADVRAHLEREIKAEGDRLQSSERMWQAANFRTRFQDPDGLLDRLATMMEGEPDMTGYAEVLREAISDNGGGWFAKNRMRGVSPLERSEKVDGKRVTRLIDAWPTGPKAGARRPVSWSGRINLDSDQGEQFDRYAEKAPSAREEAERTEDFKEPVSGDPVERALEAPPSEIFDDVESMTDSQLLKFINALIARQGDDPLVDQKLRIAEAELSMRMQALIRKYQQAKESGDEDAKNSLSTTLHYFRNAYGRVQRALG